MDVVEVIIELVEIIIELVIKFLNQDGTHLDTFIQDMGSLEKPYCCFLHRGGKYTA